MPKAKQVKVEKPKDSLDRVNELKFGKGYTIPKKKKGNIREV